MADPIELFLAGQQEFSARVAEIDTGQWDDPTPDTEWRVAELVDHLIDEHRWIAPLLDGASLDEAGRVVESLGSPAADRKAAWQQAAASSAAAFSADGALERTVQLSRGPTAARQYLHEAIFDLCLHSWDLGKAIGVDRPIDERVVAITFEAATSFGDLSATGMFDKPVPVPDAAPLLDRLVGLTGRDPGWTPPESS